jgi:hypothetical protein
MAMHSCNKHNRVGLMARLLGLLALVAALFLGSVEGQARLDPYYFLRNRNLSKITPRILFAVDTSGSMIWEIGIRANCDFHMCESTDPTRQSRIAAARSAINHVVTTTTSDAGFALMTFDHLPPPTTAAEVPNPCVYETDPNGKILPGRFDFVMEVEHDDLYVVPITNMWGTTGIWRLCGENLVYPYLRWDDLGFSNGPGGANQFFPNDDMLPEGPLALLYSDEDTWTGDVNHDGVPEDRPNPMTYRKVQFLGEFLGTRVHFDCSDPAMNARAQNSVGDYDSATEICGHDFYYFPYVDGFSGYSHGVGGGTHAMGYTEYYGCSAAYENWSCTQWTGGGVFDSCMNYDASSNACAYTAGNTYTGCNMYASGTPAVGSCAGSGCTGCNPCCCDSLCTIYGDCCADYNAWCPIQPWCQYTDFGHPFGWYPLSTVDYFWCDYYAPTAADAEACCEYIGVGLGLGGEACKSYGSSTFWGSSCGTDEACCEDVANQAGLPTDACKSYTSGTCLDWEFTGCDLWSLAGQGWTEMGIHERYQGSTASLLAPFYFEPAITKWATDPLPTNKVKAGPLDAEWANNLVLGLSSDQTHGGIDADDSTPWNYTIGAIPATVPDSNAPFSHTSVASYLKYITAEGSGDACVPTYAVIISDGEPDSTTSLYTNLAALRNTLGVKTYVVGFGVGGSIINNMACAGAGAATGCLGTPADNWDTCRTAGSSTNCAYSATSPQELKDALISIVTGALDINIPSGPGTSLNNSGVGAQSDALAQTKVTAYTEYPSWRGHVRQELCGDEDPTDENPEDGNPDNPNTLAPWCKAPPFTVDEATHATFGPCDRNDPPMNPQFNDADSLRVWDAGECLKRTLWTDRRIYSHDANNQLFRITAAGNPNAASPQFKSELEAAIGSGLLQSQADSVARFIMGENWPKLDDADPNDHGWKLPGLAMSAPIVARRIPKPDPEFIPSVGIRDPHCAGRVMSNPGEVPKSLLDFAKAAWETTIDAAGTYEYQEAVLIGDDLGVIHAFHLATGNELFGLIPRFALKSAYEQSQIGPTTRGQPQQLVDHNYGVSATVNQGWAWDDMGTAGDKSDDVWRHLVLLGMGIGGSEFIALDVSHMGRLAADDPVEVLWTTADAALQTDYGSYLGETWARPALTYRFEPDPRNEALDLEPKAYVVMGSGYQTIPPDPANEQGRRLWLANALNGEVEQFAILPAHDPAKAWDANFGALTDIAVGTHCISRYWAEMQEAYIADPYGRLFRWDLLSPPGDPKEGESDSGQPWKDSGMSAKKVWEFGTCMGAGATCSVQASPHDPFFYGPAVVANNRVDDPTGATGWDSNQEDQFLVGLVSGNMNDDATNLYGGSFHSSLYLLVDDHSTSKHAGISIPTGSPKRPPGTDSDYMRMAVTDIDRDRTIHFPDGSTETTTAKFKQTTRPLRAPRLNVYAVADEHGNVLDNVEVIIISFYFYEPGEQSCDLRWKDPVTNEWVFDSGSSYEVSFRVTVDDTQGFDLVSGSGQAYFDSVLFGGAGGGAGLIGPEVTQIDTPECETGACGPKIPLAPNLPCDPNEGSMGQGARVSVPVAWSEITGFTPIE